MAPHAMDTILQAPQWPASFSNFVTWCLMWDPKHRPNSFQALQHEYFADAVDPLIRPKSSSKLLGRKSSGYDTKTRDSTDVPQLTTRSSWFRKSLIGRDSAPAVPQHQPSAQLMSPGPSPVQHHGKETTPPKARPNASKRATWSNGPTSQLAPMPILPSIRPISPLSNAVTAQAQHTQDAAQANVSNAQAPKKIGRQLSLASHGNHYSDLQAERERSASGLVSPLNGQKEGFFSHLRKRARRLSGRNQSSQGKNHDDIEANAGRNAAPSNRSSMIADGSATEQPQSSAYIELDRALQNVDSALQPDSTHQSTQSAPQVARSGSVKRNSSLSRIHGVQGEEPGPISSRTRRARHVSSHPANRYETPDEEEELLDEALHGVQRAVRGLDKGQKSEADSHRAPASKDLNRQSLQHSLSIGSLVNPYPTPSPSAKRNGVLFNNNSVQDEPATPMNINKRRTKENGTFMWPTPPYEENEWANQASSTVYASSYR
jgi:meiosis induction protein kinase IME2/SME1